MPKASILIVDDEPVSVAVAKKTLEMQGHTVEVAANGVAGLKRCAEDPIDLVLLDLNMPRMDGYLFMEHLNERWENDKKHFSLPKIIVMTVVGKSTDFGRAENLGADKFMNKPIDPEELVGSVEEVLKKPALALAG